MTIVAGIKPNRLVESHGSFATASCTVCQSKHDPIVTKVTRNIVPIMCYVDVVIITSLSSQLGYILYISFCFSISNDNIMMCA